jgi:hypothetical protein
VGHAGHGPRSPWSECDDALRDGRAAVVSDVTLFSALHRAGLDWTPYAYGGAGWGKRFILDENDKLTEIAEDQ